MQIVEFVRNDVGQPLRRTICTLSRLEPGGDVGQLMATWFDSTLGKAARVGPPMPRRKRQTTVWRSGPAPYPTGKKREPKLSFFVICRKDFLFRAAVAGKIRKAISKGGAMQRRRFSCSALAVLGLNLWAAPAQAFSLGEIDASTGVRAALERGAIAAIGLLGRPDGFWGNAQVRIALPSYLNDAARLLKALGQQKRVDELVTAMNRVAESAVPQAKDLLISTVRSLSVQDAVRIVHGGPTSVTDFFAARTRVPLNERFLPIVTEATEHVSLAGKYNAVAGKATTFGLIKKEDAHIESYVTRKALDGLYLIIGEEEKKIRRDPVGTGSDILRRVFGR